MFIRRGITSRSRVVLFALVLTTVVVPSTASAAPIDRIQDVKPSIAEPPHICLMDGCRDEIVVCPMEGRSRAKKVDPADCRREPATFRLLEHRDPVHTVKVGTRGARLP